MLRLSPSNWMLPHVDDVGWSGFEPNITQLYHGTTAKKELICEEGLDERLGRTGRFGRGIYFR